MRPRALAALIAALPACAPAAPEPRPAAPPPAVEVAPAEDESAAEDEPPAAERDAAPAPARIQCDQSEDLEGAKRTFRAGIELYAEGDYQQAAEAFARSYQLSCRPAVLYNLGTALERAGDRAGAVQAFELFLESEQDPTRREEVERRIEQLRR